MTTSKHLVSFSGFVSPSSLVHYQQSLAANSLKIPVSECAQGIVIS